MTVYLDTCVLPRSQLQTGKIYRERFGGTIGFELLMMFDLPDFEENLKANLELFESGPLMFHEPVWGVEHTAPKGSDAWEAGMYHLRLTQKYAEILRPEKMVYHFSNCAIDPAEKDRLLCNSLDNLEEMCEMFPDVQILVENTGIRGDGTLLLDQDEFTGLCLDHRFPVLIDVGHANANGWDIPKLVHDLREQIGGFHLHNNDGIHDLHHRLRDGTVDFPGLVSLLNREVPDASRVIEYCNPVLHGEPLMEDIAFLLKLSETEGDHE